MSIYKSFYSYSFGCRVNEAEKEVFDREMVKQGFYFNQSNPDLYIINTCAVTHKAEREARQLIYQLKKRNPEAKIVITGCSATYWQKNKLYSQLPIDLQIDNINKQFLVKIIKNRLYHHSKSNLRGCQSALNNSLNIPIINKFNNSGRYILKIQDGCQRFCSYCIVPYLRGLPKSKTIEQIINEVSTNNTISELILTAINTEAFGHDTKENIVQLINRLIDCTTIPRISFGSIHPWSINEDFFKLYKTILSTKRLINFFHIPLQSGSNKILNLMKRDYTREEFIKKLNFIKSINPKSFIATDIIVGFLDETDKDFTDTYEFLKMTPINKFHIFRFSIRSNTAAYYMKNKLKEPSSQEKIKRAKILAELNEQKYEKFISSLVNWQSTALILNYKIGDYNQGLLENQIPILIKTNKKPGEIIQIKVTALKNNNLFGISI